MYTKPTVAVRINIKPNTLGGGYWRVIKNARPPNVEVEIVTITSVISMSEKARRTEDVKGRKDG
jgi:hypothetical protein